MPRVPGRFLASRAIFVAAVTIIALALSAALPNPLAFVPPASAAASDSANPGVGNLSPEPVGVGFFGGFLARLPFDAASD